MSETQWYFTWDEFQSNTMSDLEERRAAAQFIARIGKALDLVQVVIATAQVFMHRFYARESFKKFNYHEMATIFLFLAGKVEESPRKLRDIIYKNACVRFKTAQVPDTLTEGTDQFRMVYDRAIALERVALVLLCFDINITHPYRLAARLFRTHPSAFSEPFTERLWGSITASYDLPYCLLFPPKPLATALLLQAFNSEHQDTISSEDQLVTQLLIALKCHSWEEAFPSIQQAEVLETLRFISSPPFDK